MGGMRVSPGHQSVESGIGKWLEKKFLESFNIVKLVYFVKSSILCDIGRFNVSIIGRNDFGFNIVLNRSNISNRN